MAKNKWYCPNCAGADIELIGGVGGSVAVRCNECGWHTDYYDCENEALAAFDEQLRANTRIQTENATQPENGGQGGVKGD